jgi:quinol monooxygenase YgiN
VIGKAARLTEALDWCNYGERSMIIVMGYLQLATGGFSLIRSAIRPMVTATRNEAGCDHYAIAIDLVDADRLQITERWCDQAALGAHLVSDHVVDFQVAMRRTRVIRAAVNVYPPDGSVRRLINM